MREENMSASDIIMNEDEQRRFQTTFWKLPEDASWKEIRAAARNMEAGMLFFHPDDWEEAITRMYGPVFNTD